MALPALRASFQLARVNLSSEAKKVKSTFLSCSGVTGCTMATSSWTRSSCPSDSSSSSNRISTAGKLRSSRTSFSSFPFSVAAPTIATRKRFWFSVFMVLSGLRFRRFLVRRRGRFDRASPEEGSDPRHDPTEHVGHGQHKKQRTGKIVKQEPQPAHGEDQLKWMAVAEIEVLEAVEPPGADHEEGRGYQ